jgi:hypothetical protein
MVLACIIVAASILTSAAHRHGVFVAWWVIPLVFLIVRRSRRGSRDS